MNSDRRLPLSLTGYYFARPLIPRSLQIAVRRRWAKRRRRACSDRWPVCEAAGRAPEGWRGWPDGKRFGFVLTHDVDTARGAGRCMDLIEMERSMGFRSSFNLVPERYELPEGLVDRIRAMGFEVAVHGLHHDGKLFRSRAVFERRAVRINRYLRKWNAVGFRAPSMHHNLSWIRALDVRYDSSTFDVDPFEPQRDAAFTIFPFWVPASHDRAGYLEIPYTLPQDSTLFVLLQETSPRLWQEKLDWIVRKGGMALINVHPDYATRATDRRAVDEYPLAYYEEFLAYVRDRYAGEYWHGTPADLLPVMKLSPEVVGTPDQESAEQPASAPRVCVLRHGYYPSDCRVYKEVRALRESGFEIDVICLRGSDSQASEIIDGVCVRRLPGTHCRGSALRYVLQYGASLVTMFVLVSFRAFRRRYAVVQVNTMPDFLVFAACFAKWLGARVLLDMHEPMPELYLTKYEGRRPRLAFGLQVRLEQAAMRYADHVFTVNETLKRRFVERGAVASKISIVRNVPDESFAQSAEPKQENNGFVLGTHGTLQPRYGHDVIIRALPLLRQRIEGLRLVVLGSGETEGRLRALAERLDCLDVIDFKGTVPFSRVAGILSQMDVGLVPLMPTPFSELCQPNKLFEYVALRVPVAAARLKAIEESFDDSSIAFFTPGDHEDLARSVFELYDSPERRSTLAGNAYRCYQDLRWSVAKQSYVNVVAELAKRGEK